MKLTVEENYDMAIFTLKNNAEHVLTRSIPLESEEYRQFTAALDKVMHPGEG